MTYRCQRCDFKTDDNDQAGAHMRETGHKRCICCARSLTTAETLTCERCIANVRADLADIAFAYAMLDQVIEYAGFRSDKLPGGDALVLTADGSLDSPQRPNQYTEPVILGPTAHLERLTIPGKTETRADGHIDDYTHPAYIEERIPSDGREHVRDHWKSDPSPVIAVLETWQRDWRITFKQPPAAALATVTGCIGYLNLHLPRAAREHLAFDDFTSDINDLRWRLTHVAGTANDPLKAEAECFDCGGALIRDYREPVLPRPPATRRKGVEREGATDIWECQRCHRLYKPAEYMLAVRGVLEARALAK